jgi:hypothetical protein
MHPLAVMNIDKGEEIVAGFVSGHIPGTGRYKFVAKKKINGKYEWAHFVERDDGLKENVYRGEVGNPEELKLVFDIMNKTLKKIFGSHTEMKEGKPEFKSITGKKFDDTIN